MKALPQGSWVAVAWIGFTACLGIAALAAGVQRWLLRRLSLLEQWVMILSGLALIYPAPAADLAGLAGIAAVLVWQWLGRKAVVGAGG